MAQTPEITSIVTPSGYSYSTTVNYTIPEGTYSYIKIVGKKGSAPENASDGNFIFDITQSRTSSIFSRLDRSSTYYFKIFTDVSSSNTMSTTTPPERFTLVASFTAGGTTYNYTYPQWFKTAVDSAFTGDPSSGTSIAPSTWSQIYNELYDDQIITYPLEFRTNFGSYPEGESYPSRVSYEVSNDIKFEWGKNRDNDSDLYGYVKVNGSWMLACSVGFGYGIAKSYYKSMLFPVFILDNQLEKGYFGGFCVSYGANNSWCNCNVYKLDVTGEADIGYTLIYNLFHETPSEYNWANVSSISGKNGTLYALSTLTDINSGNPITTSDTTKFSLSPTTNVGRLVSDRMNSGA